MHFMAFPDAAGEQGQQTAAYTQKFVAVLYPRCQVVPVFTDLTYV